MSAKHLQTQTVIQEHEGCPEGSGHAGKLEPTATAAKAAKPARNRPVRTSGDSSPVPAPETPPKAPRWSGPLPKSVLTCSGRSESGFPTLEASEASRKAAEAAKKKAEEPKKPKKEEKTQVGKLPTVEEKDEEGRHWRPLPCQLTPMGFPVLRTS